MPEKIKITMLGASGAGKTCYMITMYKMMNLGIGLNGFTLSASDSDDNVRFADLWKYLEEDQSMNRWPAPTGDETFKYEFNFNFNHKPILGFDWFDYRGGALEDFRIKPDVIELRKRLTDTSCIYLCVSGEHFVTKLKLRAYQKVGVGGINQLMADTNSNNLNNTPPAVVIVITKHDLCSHRPAEEILSEVRELFSVFFATGAKWLVMVCPVSLGEEIAIDPTGGEIQPKNVHLPVLFAMYADLLRKTWALNSNREENMEELNRLESNFVSRWIQKSSIARKKEDLEYVNNNLSNIQSKLLVLANQFENTEIRLFFNGKECQLRDYML